MKITIKNKPTTKRLRDFDVGVCFFQPVNSGLISGYKMVIDPFTQTADKTKVLHLTSGTVHYVDSIKEFEPLFITEITLSNKK